MQTSMRGAKTRPSFVGQLGSPNCITDKNQSQMSLAVDRCRCMRTREAEEEPTIVVLPVAGTTQIGGLRVHGRWGGSRAQVTGSAQLWPSLVYKSISAL